MSKKMYIVLICTSFIVSLISCGSNSNKKIISCKEVENQIIGTTWFCDDGIFQHKFHFIDNKTVEVCIRECPQCEWHKGTVVTYIVLPVNGYAIQLSGEGAYSGGALQCSEDGIPHHYEVCGENYGNLQKIN